MPYLAGDVTRFKLKCCDRSNVGSEPEADVYCLPIHVSLSPYLMNLEVPFGTGPIFFDK